MELIVYISNEKSPLHTKANQHALLNYLFHVQDVLFIRALPSKHAIAAVKCTRCSSKHLHRITQVHAGGKLLRKHERPGGLRFLLMSIDT